MKIELKNTEFKELYEFLKQLSYEEEELNIHSIVFDKLKSQYDKAFNKYKDEKQEFKLKEKVKFQCWDEDEWDNGFIHKVSRLANGQYKYVIGYKDDNEYNQLMNEKYSYTNPLTKKNIRKRI